MIDVFHAVADPTRRLILSSLRERGPLSVTVLSATLPMSRQAVTKHLDILEAAGLVGRTIRGRERMHHLQAEPLMAVEDWLAPYTAAWDERLARLRTHLDGGENERADD
jgi:DNA-binding transcriptional ArsR family regulator